MEASRTFNPVLQQPESAMMSRYLCLAVAMSVRVADTGTSADDLCQATCTTVSSVETCSFTAKIDPYLSYMGYWKFDECGDTVMPYLEIKQNVEYTFIQSDPSNWYHPLGFAYFADGPAHNAWMSWSPASRRPRFVRIHQPVRRADVLPRHHLPRHCSDQAPRIDGVEELRLVVVIKRDGLARGSRMYVITPSAHRTTSSFCHIHNEMSGYMKILDAACAGRQHDRQCRARVRPS